MSIQALKDNLAHAKKIKQGSDILIATRAEVEAALAEYERLDAEFAEAGIALRVAKEQAAHWRDAYERTPTIAAEECNRQKEELEAQLAEAKKHASALHDGLDVADRQYTAMVKELEAEIASLKTLYDATADGLQVATQLCEVARRERDGERAQAQALEAQLKEAKSEHDRYHESYYQTVARAESLEDRLELAECELAKAREETKEAHWRAAEANARVDIWERDYTNCDSSPLNEYRKRAEKAERRIAHLDDILTEHDGVECTKHDVLVRAAMLTAKDAESKYVEAELRFQEERERVAALEAALKRIRELAAPPTGNIGDYTIALIAARLRNIGVVAQEALEADARQSAETKEAK